MIVMTMILTRLTVKSSNFRAKSGVYWAKQVVILASPSVSNKFTYALGPWLVRSFQKNLRVYVTRRPRPISGANSLMNDKWLR
jgi:hypothetical protein